MAATQQQVYQRYLDGFVEAFVQKRDAKSVAKLYSDDAVLLDPSTGEQFRGREAIAEWHDAYIRAFSDVQLEWTSVLPSGDYVATELLMRATHTGHLATPQGEIAPTGKRIAMRACFIGRFNSDGLCTEDRTYFDSASMMQQLGLM